MPLSLFAPSAPHGHSAIFSEDRVYRYALERRWGSGPFVLFVMLNPSTADEHVDDQTIRRCVGFARDWGYGGLIVANLFAFRATDPRELATVEDPVGPDCDVWLDTCSARSALVVVAWGSHRRAAWRAGEVLERFDTLACGIGCLGRNADRSPRHPSRLARSTQLEPYGP